MTCFSSRSAQAAVHGSKLLWYSAGARDQEHVEQMIAKQLGVIQGVVANFLAGIESQDFGVSEALQPFDVDHWAQHASDSALP